MSVKKLVLFLMVSAASFCIWAEDYSAYTQEDHLNYYKDIRKNLAEGLYSSSEAGEVIVYLLNYAGDYRFAVTVAESSGLDIHDFYSGSLKDSEYIDEAAEFGYSTHQIDAVLALIDSEVHHVREAELLYLAGNHYAEIGNNHKALKLYKKLLKLYPASPGFLDINWHVSEVRSRIYFLIVRVVNIIFVILSLFIMALFFIRYKGYKKIRLKEHLFCLVLLLVWTVLFFLTVYFLMKNREWNYNTKILQPVEGSPSYIGRGLGVPGYKVVISLYFYGVALCFWIHMMFISASCYKKVWKKRGIALFIFFSVLSAGVCSSDFYYRYCYRNSVLSKGEFQFSQREPERFILTQPEIFSRLNVMHINDPELVEWIVTHVPYLNNPEAASEETE